MMNRELIKNKFGGLCAYSGTTLEDNWQVDHYLPKRYCKFAMMDPDAFDNLIPCQRIVNHYKNSLMPETFRDRLATLHKRLKKLPKNPKVSQTIRHKEYLLEVAELFGITPDIPFSGVFYFERV